MADLVSNLANEASIEANELIAEGNGGVLVVSDQKFHGVRAGGRLSSHLDKPCIRVELILASAPDSDDRCFTGFSIDRDC
jgi:hypothetical protein